MSVAGFALSLAIVPAWWNMLDLQVYQLGADTVLHGHSLYQVRLHLAGLAFTYPPFAAAAFAPFALLGGVGARLLTLAGSFTALLLVTTCCADARPRSRRVGSAAAMTGFAAAVWSEPVQATLHLGQINLFLMGLVIVDLLGRTGRIPTGVLTGIATGIKLTPAIFILYLLATRRPRAAAQALAAFAGTVAVGAVVDPAASVRYWSGVIIDARRAGRVEYASNQSLDGLLTRLAGSARSAAGMRPEWIGLCMVVLALGVIVAVRAHASGQELLAVALIGLTGLLISPISWTHHWVWAIPAGWVLIERAVARCSAGTMIAAAAWIVTFLLAPMWWIPHDHGREFRYHGIELVIGNFYVLAALAFLLLTARTLRTPARAAVDTPSRAGVATAGAVRRRHRRGGRPPTFPGRPACNRLQEVACFVGNHNLVEHTFDSGATVTAGGQFAAMASAGSVNVAANEQAHSLRGRVEGAGQSFVGDPVGVQGRDDPKQGVHLRAGPLPPMRLDAFIRGVFPRHSANAPMTESSTLAIGESSPVKVSCSLMNSTRTPRAVSVRTIARRSQGCGPAGPSSAR